MSSTNLNNTGQTIVVPPAKTAELPITKSMYQDLRHQIISMEIAPGADLDEQQLVKKFGVSRTPVREALIRLSAEGLVEIRKNRGATVTSLDLLTLQSIFEAGDLIEKAYMRLACLRRTDNDLSEINAIRKTFDADLKRKDISAMVDSNSRFHLRIAEAARNKYFVESYRRILADHERIAQFWYSHNLQQPDESVNKKMSEQHLGLFEALKDRDIKKAEQVSMDHANLCKQGVRTTLVHGEEIVVDLKVEPNPLGTNW